MDDPVVSHSQSNLTTFKSLHGMPCLSLAQAGTSYKKLSPERQEIIKKKIIDTNDERWLALFNVATLLPRELQIRVVSELFRCHVNKDELSKQASDWILECKRSYYDEISMHLHKVNDFVVAANKIEHSALSSMVKDLPYYNIASRTQELHEKIGNYFSSMEKNSKEPGSEDVNKLKDMLIVFSNMRSANIFLDYAAKDGFACRMDTMIEQGDNFDRLFRLLSSQRECAEIFVDGALVDMLNIYNLMLIRLGSDGVLKGSKARHFYKVFSLKKLQTEDGCCLGYSHQELEKVQPLLSRQSFLAEQKFSFKYREKFTFKNVRENWGIFYPMSMVPFVSQLLSPGYGLWGLMHFLSWPIGFVLTNYKKNMKYYFRCSFGRHGDMVGCSIGAGIGSMIAEQCISLFSPIWGENPWIGMGIVTAVYSIISCKWQKDSMSVLKTKYTNYSKVLKHLNNPDIEIE